MIRQTGNSPKWQLIKMVWIGAEMELPDRNGYLFIMIFIIVSGICRSGYYYHDFRQKVGIDLQAYGLYGLKLPCDREMNKRKPGRKREI